MKLLYFFLYDTNGFNVNFRTLVIKTRHADRVPVEWKIKGFIAVFETYFDAPYFDTPRH